eukprot:TRINITY_DN20628_c2_g1_i1.p1 TRINITY_DN20628_c2_g1~~TRINITY_DN20628_c2_g1_i1.p1  ORF type:complete len:208 (-),score=29.07 TRINITY_DN20628_c2_g1_i1:186-809(-)
MDSSFVGVVAGGSAAPNGTPSARGRKRRRGAAGGAEGDVVSRKDVMGTIRIFNAEKGWGFVDGDDVGGDIFLHAKHFVSGAPSFWIGHKSNTKDREKAPRIYEGPVRVSFDLALSNQGKPQAVNVRLIGDYPQLEMSAGSFEDRLAPEGACWSSPICSRCGSTVAAHFGISACPLCGQWLPQEVIPPTHVPAPVTPVSPSPLVPPAQ